MHIGSLSIAILFYILWNLWLFKKIVSIVLENDLRVLLDSTCDLQADVSDASVFAIQ